MRPDTKQDKFTPDDVLKQNWLNDLDKKDILCVFDDRQKVVDMWRKNGLSCFQVHSAISKKNLKIIHFLLGFLSFFSYIYYVND